MKPDTTAIIALLDAFAAYPTRAGLQLHDDDDRTVSYTLLVWASARKFAVISKSLTACNATWPTWTVEFQIGDITVHGNYERRRTELDSEQMWTVTP